MNTQKTVIGILAIGVLFSLWISMSQKPQVITEIKPGAVATLGQDIIDLNGVGVAFRSSAFTQATSTVCSFRAPSATSTLVFASAQISTGTTTVLSFEIAKDTTFAATTTRLALAILPSGAKATMVVATTSTSALTPTDQDYVFAPNTYLNFKIGGPNGPTNVLVGSCKAEFILN